MSCNHHDGDECCPLAEQPACPRQSSPEVSRSVATRQGDRQSADSHLLTTLAEAVLFCGQQSPAASWLLARIEPLLPGSLTLECRDALRLFALLLNRLQQGGRGSRQAKLDALSVPRDDGQALAMQSPNTAALLRGSWRRKSRGELGHASWLDALEAALWCFWHSDTLRDGHQLAVTLLAHNRRAALIYGWLAGLFYCRR